MKKISNLSVGELLHRMLQYQEAGIDYLDLEIPEGENKITLKPALNPPGEASDKEEIITAA